MNIQDIIAGIVAQKEFRGLTNQQIADAAQLSKTTVDRTLRNDAGSSPTLQTILAIADVVGCEVRTLDDDTPTSERQRMDELYDDRVRRIEERYAHMIKLQNRWLRFTVILCLFLTVFIIVVLLYDVTHPDIGWIRDHLN